MRIIFFIWLVDEPGCNCNKLVLHITPSIPSRALPNGCRFFSYPGYVDLVRGCAFNVTWMLGNEITQLQTNASNLNDAFHYCWKKYTLPFCVSSSLNTSHHSKSLLSSQIFTNLVESSFLELVQSNKKITIVDNWKKRMNWNNRRLNGRWMRIDRRIEREMSCWRQASNWKS